MSVGFPNLSWWLWSGKKKDAKLLRGNSSLNSSVVLDVRNYPAGSGGNSLGSNSSSKKVRRKWLNCVGSKVDKEHDSVILPTDGGEFSSDSDSDSDASDWSIGWSEPHAPGFLSEDEIESGFGVLVRCYGRGSGGKQDLYKNNVDHSSRAPSLHVTNNKKYMEQWLSSLQGS